MTWYTYLGHFKFFFSFSIPPDVTVSKRPVWNGPIPLESIALYLGREIDARTSGDGPILLGT